MKKFMKWTSAFLFLVATLAASTPSQFGMYQPNCPEKLKK